MNQIPQIQSNNSTPNLATTGYGNSYALAIKTFQEALQFAEMLSKTNLVPMHYKNKPEEIMAAWQKGGEIGLPRMVALETIIPIKGKYCMYGDGLLGLVQASSVYEWHKETDDGHTATCTVKRKGSPPHTVTFSMDDAKRAGLLDKKTRLGQSYISTYQLYPATMRKYRARYPALKDQFADVLCGLRMVEEVMDYHDVEFKDIRHIKLNGKDMDTIAKEAVELVKQQESGEGAYVIYEDEDVNSIASGEVREDHNGFELVATEEQITEWHAWVNTVDLKDKQIDKVLKAAEVNRVEEMPYDKMQKWIDHLKKKAQQQAEGTV